MFAAFEFVANNDYGSLGNSDFTYKTEATKNYLAECTRRTRKVIGSAEGRFPIAQAEHLDEQVVMGTSGIFAEEDELNNEQPFYFRSCGVETCVIDENEKGQQVALMRDIYKTAISVQIWLGAGSEATSTAADFLKPLAENSESYGIKRWIHQGHF